MGTLVFMLVRKILSSFGTPLLYRSPVIFYQSCCQNLPIDGVRKLAEEYTTTMFFTILTNKTLPNLPSQGGFAPLDPPCRPCPKTANCLPEQRGKVVCGW